MRSCLYQRLRLTAIDVLSNPSNSSHALVFFLLGHRIVYTRVGKIASTGFKRRKKLAVQRAKSACGMMSAEVLELS
jgi:hypothetical protein